MIRISLLFCILIYNIGFGQDQALERYLTITEYVKNKDCDKVNTLIDKALSEKDQYFYIIQNLKARCLFDGGSHFHKVDSILKICLEIKKDNPFYDDCKAYTHWLYSMHYYKISDPQNDEKHTKLALKHFDKNSPEYSVLVSNLGYVQLELKKYEQAIKTFTKSLKHDNRNSFGYNNRAYAYILTDQLKQAEKDLKVSESLNSLNPYLYKNYALLYLKQKRGEKACIMLEKAKELGFYSFGNYDNTEVNDLLQEHCK